eukprot:CAMPEP_0194289630 /NCGR_PEP_ID=MMETSP0169-20130528/39465_1 /TAXON_ID=218684 /ORGANISM="Corethron pennatum, Strain L29A3" /LENGTH=66 /DNA_ID=CAMNT_0039036963 /DNA_START=34 /DNA_END=230 /DNA_ORIENTATION=-
MRAALVSAEAQVQGGVAAVALARAQEAGSVRGRHLVGRGGPVGEDGADDGPFAARHEGGEGGAAED